MTTSGRLVASLTSRIIDVGRSLPRAPGARRGSRRSPANRRRQNGPSRPSSRSALPQTSRLRKSRSKLEAGRLIARGRLVARVTRRGLVFGTSPKRPGHTPKAAVSHSRPDQRLGSHERLVTRRTRRRNLKAAPASVWVAWLAAINSSLQSSGRRAAVDDVIHGHLRPDADGDKRCKGTCATSRGYQPKGP